MVEVHIFRTAVHKAIGDQKFSTTFRPSFSPEWPKTLRKSYFYVEPHVTKHMRGEEVNLHAFRTSVMVNVPHHDSAAFIPNTERSGREPGRFLQSF